MTGRSECMRDDGHIAAGTGGIQIDPMLIRRQILRGGGKTALIHNRQRAGNYGIASNIDSRGNH